MPPQPRSSKKATDVDVTAAARLGVAMGGALSGVAIAWLLIANRVPALDGLALLRNLTAGALLIALMLVPVCRFRRHPSHLFGCGITAWSVLTLIYAILQIPFPRLGIRMGTFHFFMMGAVFLALTSALLWVGQLVLTLCHGPAVPARKRAH
jgi:hypothetical protein